MLEKVAAIIREQLNQENVEITEATRFKEDLEVDSLDLFELVMAFEEEYGVSIPSGEECFCRRYDTAERYHGYFPQRMERWGKRSLSGVHFSGNRCRRAIPPSEGRTCTHCHGSGR